MANFVGRMIGAATLNVPVVEEIEGDNSYTVPALAVVVMAALAAGLGGLGEGSPGFFALLVMSLFGWVFWAFLTWIIGTKLLATPDTKSDMGELLRTMGFAQSPGLLRAFCFVPVLGVVIDVVVAIWLLATTVVAVRQSLDYKSTWRAILVCLIGWAVNFVILVVLRLTA